MAPKFNSLPAPLVISKIDEFLTCSVRRVIITVLGRAR